MAVLAQEARGSDDEINTIDTTLDSLLGILHITPDVCENLGLFQVSVIVSSTQPIRSVTDLEAELADGLAVLERLRGGYGASELNVVDTEFAEHRRDLDLVLCREEGVGKLSTG